MKVKDMIQLAAELMGRQDLADYLAGETAEQAEEQAALQKEAALLLRCFNLVENELAFDYYPLLCTELVETDSGAIFYHSLKREAINIRSIQDLHGNERKFVLYPEYCKTDAGRLKITYSYLPAQKTMEGDSDYQLKFSERLFAYGIACEYALISGEYEQATVWDKRYREALRSALRTETKGSMRAKKWV